MLKVFLLNGALIALVVVIHYEFLLQFTKFIPRLPIKHRFRIVFGVLVALTAHTVEVWIFGAADYWMDAAEGWGQLQGNFDDTLMSAVYFSFTSYTTLGLGDIEPVGDIRFLAGLESLTGFVLVTWTASFLYLEMARYWNKE